MNRPGQCTDNAEVESFFITLKGELLHATSFMTLRQLRKHIRDPGLGRLFRRLAAAGAAPKSALIIKG